MKKILAYILIIGLLTFVGFGPVTANAAEKGPWQVIGSGHLLK